MCEFLHCTPSEYAERATNLDDVFLKAAMNQRNEEVKSSGR
jgi:hypothetical protein